MAERLALLISGGGSTMQEIVKASKSGELSLEIACVIASRPDAAGIEKAKALGIPEKDIVVIPPRRFRNDDGNMDQDRFGETIVDTLTQRDTTIVTQNGWMHLTPTPVIEAYDGRIFNQHPGPVPEFGGKGMYGRRVHAARLLFAKAVGRDMWTEAVAQRVAPTYDDGAVVRVEQVEIFPTDTPEDLQGRVLPIEHKLQIALLHDVISGSVTEVPSRPTLVRPDELSILERAKQSAIALYPKG
jgi:phosphoribosylglycinamide formyltransferase 1